MWMQTYTGRTFDFTDIANNEIVIEDIAHALACINRFGGHTKEPYSVAQHSCVICDLCSEENKLHGLLHDAPEAYMGDMVGPLKCRMPIEYDNIEEDIWMRICEEYGIGAEVPGEVLELDKRILVNEANFLRGGPVNNWTSQYGEPVELSGSYSLVDTWGYRRAELEFLDRFRRYHKCSND